MFKLKAVIEVEADAIVRHLLTEVQGRLHGPDFSVGEVVTFTEAPAPDPIEPRNTGYPGHSSFGQDIMVPGNPAVVAGFRPKSIYEEATYEVLVVSSEGETLSLNVAPTRLVKSPELTPQAA